MELEEIGPLLEGIYFKSISMREGMEIETPFLEEEIKKAVWDCGGAKSSGPDGYSFLIIKKCWSFIKDDFIKFFHYLFNCRSISKAVTSSFITLIPKSHNPLSLEDYRSICLVGCMYNVIAKLLAGRLNGVLNSIISPSESAFVLGRQLLDGVLVANVVVDYARKKGKNSFLFKVDFEKAYDKVNWNFLIYMLKRMAF